MENDKSQILQRLKAANNVLVTVSQNPSVDQLSAAIGMTLVLNKMGKHGTAVFSGAVPSTIEFLKPEETLEKNTDSLRDFIIALDKSKADKLRYKVEDQHVKIFITPYHTTITDADLDFSHGDFNVDVVLALGVHVQKDLDQAITAHGRILHDATVVSVNTNSKGELGGINLSDQSASSLSEVMASLSIELKNDVLDAQIATAFLTGIVAETDRFSNEKTKPATMSISAKLMAAGANQQLVATKLQEPPKPPAEPEAKELAVPKPAAEESQANSDGSLDIDHSDASKQIEEIHIDEHGNMQPAPDEAEKTALPANGEDAKSAAEEPKPKAHDAEGIGRPKRMTEPPTHGGTLTASGQDKSLEQSTDPLSAQPAASPILRHNDATKIRENDDTAKTAKEKPAGLEAPASELPEPQPFQAPTSQPQEESSQEQSGGKPVEQSLDDLEKAVNSPHQLADSDTQPTGTNSAAEEAPNLDELQSAVNDALANSDSQPPEPAAALNATTVDMGLEHKQTEGGEPTQNTDEYLDVSKLDDVAGTETAQSNGGLPQDLGLPEDSTSGSVHNPTPPPPVPPPMMPPSMQDESGDDINLPPVNQ